MAVIEGARLRTAAPLTRTAPRDAAPAARLGVRGTARIRPAGLLMGGILAATIVGLVYLTQTLGSNATSSEIRDLSTRREELGRQLRNLAVAMETYADPEELGRRARKLGLDRLDAAIVLPAP